MGPLMSLLKANVVRGEFLRINRDITSTFGLLAAGEQLLVRAETGSFWCQRAALSLDAQSVHPLGH
jgi:hypothetical protein